jgi:tetraacyldisaccharide 4'-kinase
MRLEPPPWWFSGRMPLAAWGLWPVSFIYGNIVEARFAMAAPYRSKLPVICVGNFTMGGAGKTPVALRLADLLAETGRKPAFLSRGYGGQEPGPRAVDSNNDTAEAVGDEPLLLARTATTVISRKRPAGAQLLEKLGAGMIIMDDGFQNPSLRKDFSLLVVDAGAGIGSGRVFPLGPLRAPLAFQAGKADAILVLGSGDSCDLTAKFTAIPVFRAAIAPAPTAHLAGRRFVAFCGIGRPAKFFATLRDAGLQIIQEVGFPDHHPYTEAEARRLLDLAREKGAELITTEKDHVRLARKAGVFEDLYHAAATLPITVRFADDGEGRLLKQIREALPRPVSPHAPAPPIS